MNYLSILTVFLLLISIPNGIISSPVEGNTNSTDSEGSQSDTQTTNKDNNPDESKQQGDLFGAALLLEKILAEEKYKLLDPNQPFLFNPQLLLFLGFKSVPQCVTDLYTVLMAARKRELWSLEMLDSLGKADAGILRGINKFPGEFDECMDVDTGRSFDTRFCRTIIGASKVFNITLAKPFGFNWGMCIPDTCSGKEIEGLINLFLYTRPEVTAGAFETECNDPDRDLSDKAIVVICLIGIIVTILVVATVYDIYLQFKAGRAKENTSINGLEEPVANGSRKPFSEREPIIDPDLHKHTRYSNNSANDSSTGQQAGPSKLETFKQVLLSFSMYTNSAKLLSTEHPPGSITCLSGIRFLSMTIVILFHFYNHYGLPVNNWKPYLEEAYDKYSFMIVLNASLAVDSFFAISGLLITYLTLKELNKTALTPGFFGNFYFNRLWRLTPPYMLIMMLYVPLFKYIYDGPIWLYDGFEDDDCKDTWWTNLLYINNFVKDKDMCMAWTWYLANDMQFYLISPLLFIPMFFYDWRGLIVSFAMLVGNAICSGVISDANDLPAVQRLEYLKPGSNDDYWSAYYIKPYTRIGPFIIGAMTGFLMYKTQREVKMSKWVVIVGWILSTVISNLVMYGPSEHIVDDTYSTSVAALYNALHRIVWAICMCWLIFACDHGYGGFVNTLLSWKGFVPLGKMTYCAYLIHPIVNMFHVTSQRRPYYMSGVNVAWGVIATGVISYALAALATVAYELPFVNLRKVMKNYKKKATNN